MDPVQEVINDILAHSKRVYDPVKAREYYLRTRELKGRQSSSGLKTETKKQQWQYVKDQVKGERKEAFDTAKEDQKKTVQTLRAGALARREKLRDKLKTAIAALTENRKDDLEDVSEDVDSKIAALPLVPKGVTKERRIKLSAERKEKIAEIRGEAKEERASVSTDTKEAKTKTRETASVDRTAIATNLKGSIDTARSNYKKLKDDLKAKYEAEYQTEYDAIKNQ